MSRTLTMTAIAALLAGPAMADGVNYARLSYDYTQFDVDGGEETEVGLFEGDIEYKVGQILLGADLSNTNVSFGDFDTDRFEYDLSAAYILSPEVLFGAGINGFDQEQDTVIGTIDTDATGYEVFGQYQTAEFGVAVNVTSEDSDEDNVETSLYGEYVVSPDVALAAIIRTDSEDEDEDPNAQDGSRYVLSASYDQGPVFARAFLNGDTEIEASTFGVRGDYQFAPQFYGTGSYVTNFGDEAIEAYVVTVGGAYEFAEGVRADANIGFVDGDDFDEDITRFQLALTYELGQRARLDRRLDQDVVDDGQAGFSGFGFDS